MKTSTLRNIVDNVEHVGGWLTILGKVFGKEVEEYAEGYHDWKIKETNRLNKMWKKEQLKVFNHIAEFKKENKEFENECKERQKQELIKKLNDEKLLLEKIMEQRASTFKKIIQLEKVKRLEKIVNLKITQREIEIAEAYPIENIIEVDSRGFALCVNHPDKNPSMYCKNNYAHCFSCGWTGNTIKVLMKKENLNFKEAVNRLQ
jgi:hypothetical protein